ncbi:MAG: hypothetical protein K6A38_05515 [Lachnospiraceae bacterium]|nr:hypothetical protein [Lachnospiraceae bacterium]
MDNRILAILDGEERYARGLMEFLSKKESLPFRIHIFTDAERFFAYKGNEEIECLLVSERTYIRKLNELSIPNIIILSESGKIIDNTLLHIDKYQSGENIYRQILEYYASTVGSDLLPIIRHGERLKVIGIYTPVGRCLQTTFACTLGQILAKRSKTLYLNFERYSGLSTLLRREFESDISDLMYYFECSKEMLSIRLEGIVEKIGDLDFIPPCAIYQNLAGIKGKQWVELFRHIEQTTGYEYLILDLTDGMLDLWDVLRYSDIIYTISKQDNMARAKVYQYEKALRAMAYEDVLDKTKKLSFPVFHHISQKFDDLSAGELFSFVRSQIVPEIYNLNRLK